MNDRESEGVVVAEFNLDAIWDMRIGWGVFRDRRPEMYEVMYHIDSRR